jgi:uncharacterized lipoprotein YddW (UPF0748 family)
VQQQEEFTRLLDELKAAGCNAVIVQVRPACDALYASKIEPWSRYLTGREGEPPSPYYDPLVFMINEAHKRNMEFHAWFNPYRALAGNKKVPNAKNHITRTHPDWIINYGSDAIIDPGIPEARDYVISVITDVVRRYDIDGVHMDDYFYPYPEGNKPFGDTKTYARYGNGMPLGDWRRNNVSIFISLLNTEIKHIKPAMKLGISPFGVWRNKSTDPEGSDTHGGVQNYDDLYADVVLWMQKGWIDYLMPQLYWEHESHAGPFSTLMNWWYGRCYQRHMYYGLGLYRMLTAKKGAWTSVQEILWQIRDIRQHCPNTGYCMFSATNLDHLRAPVKDSLQFGVNKYPALLPTMPWLDSIPPAAPVLKMEVSVIGNVLKWTEANPQKEPIKYVVYRFPGNEPVNLDRSDRIVAIQQETFFKDIDSWKNKHCTYIVTALDRMWNESKPSNKVVNQ